jgi:serine/threonine protein phosphatase PrpC
MENGNSKPIRGNKKSKTVMDAKPTSNIKNSIYLEKNSAFCDYMEDFAIAIDNFNKESNRHLYCIFDGHGGDVTAKLCAKKFPEIFRKCLVDNPIDYEFAIKKSFYLMDKEIENLNVNETGNTATIVFIHNKLLYCANVGDSSCCIIGKTNEFLTRNHKCTNEDEIKRIQKEGGEIIENRLGGILCITRGLGDFDLKKKGLICEPYITKKLIDHNIDYCVLASDGVWDVLSPDDVAKITKNHKIDILPKKIVEEAIEKGSQDNISCIVIEFNKIKHK